MIEKKRTLVKYTDMNCLTKYGFIDSDVIKESNLLIGSYLNPIDEYNLTDTEEVIRLYEYLINTLGVKRAIEIILTQVSYKNMSEILSKKADDKIFILKNMIENCEQTVKELEEKKKNTISKFREIALEYYS